MPKFQGGVEGVLEMLRHMEDAERRKLLANLAERDPQLVAELEKRIYSFEDLRDLEARELQELIRTCPPGKVALALRRASEPLKTKIYASLPARAAQAIRDELDSLGPRRLSDIEQAQTEVLRVARDLETQGKLLLTKRSVRDP